MKNILLTALTAIIILSGCKKDKHKPVTLPNNQPTEQSTPQWQLYTKTSSSLPDNQINAIAIDQNDIKWIGTANGLVRIAGAQWTTYNIGNSPLPSNFIQALTLQSDGTVWVGTNMGLARFTGNTWTVYTMSNSTLPDRAVMSLTYDPLNQRTWVGTAKGLVKIEANDQWQVFEEIEGELILSMAADQNGALWLGTHEPVSFRGKIRKFANNKWTSYQLAPMGYESAFPYSIGINKNNEVIALLAGTAVKSVIRFTNNSWEEVPRPENAHGLRALLLEDDKIWVGGTVLSIFGNTKNSVIDLPGSKSAGILTVAMDKQKRKWIGTTSDGLFVYRD